jgi:large subunit ribosomal protein L25
MSQEQLAIAAVPRTELGSGAAGRFRRAGQLPAVIYGEGSAAEPVLVGETDMVQIFKHHASGNVLLDLTVEGKPVKKVLLADAQHHPITGRLEHVDFRTVSLTHKLKLDVPIECVGDAVGVVTDGGTLDQLIREVEIECLPTEILEIINLDVSALGIGDTLTVEDLPLDRSKYTVLTAPDVAVVSVAAPRVEETLEEEGAEGEAGEEPEVIGGKKEDGEESSDDS